MSDLHVLMEQLMRLVRQVEGLQATPLPPGQTSADIDGLVYEALRRLRPVGIALDLIEDQLVHGDRPVSSGELIDEVIARVSGQMGVPAIDLDALELDPKMVQYVRKEVADKHQLIAFGFAQKPSGEILLRVAMVDPTNIFARDDVKFLTGQELEIYVASKDAIARAIAKYYPDPDPPPPSAARAG